MRQALRRDASHGTIVGFLRTLGCLVWTIERSDPPGVPDLLVLPRRGKYKGRWVMVEVKEPKGELRPSQVEFFAWACEEGAPDVVVRSVDEAMALVTE